MPTGDRKRSGQRAKRLRSLVEDRRLRVDDGEQHVDDEVDQQDEEAEDEGDRLNRRVVLGGDGVTSVDPSPVQAKMYSISTVPAINPPSRSPEIVSVAVSMFGRACRR